MTGPGPLPERVAPLLARAGAPPRLRAHLRLVHDVARELVDWAAEHHPAAAIDAEAVLFGAATHDIGKALHPAELSGPGSEHEPAGYALLREFGLEERLARFARTHAAWDGPDTGLDDLLDRIAAGADERLAFQTAHSIG